MTKFNQTQTDIIKAIKSTHNINYIYLTEDGLQLFADKPSELNHSGISVPLWFDKLFRDIDFSEPVDISEVR